MCWIVAIANRHEHLQRHQDQLVFLKLAVVNRCKSFVIKPPFEVAWVLLPHNSIVMRFNQVNPNSVNLFIELALVLVDPSTGLRVSVRQDSKLQETLNAL